MKNLTQFETAKTQLNEYGIASSDIQVYQKGLPSEHYSFHVKYYSIEQLQLIYDAAQKNNLIAKLNIARLLDGSDVLIIDFI